MVAENELQPGRMRGGKRYGGRPSASGQPGFRPSLGTRQESIPPPLPEPIAPELVVELFGRIGRSRC